jgi:ligand-binding sensor domain-containing protein
MSRPGWFAHTAARLLGGLLLALWSVACWVGSSVHAEKLPPSYAFTEYTTEEGLPSNLVKDALFDDKGFLWVATDAGALRHDGVDVQVLVDEKSLPIAFVKAIRKLRDGRLLLAADSGLWVARMEAGRATASRLPGADSVRYVRTLFEDTRGVVWFSDRQHVYRLQKGQLSRLEMPESAWSLSFFRGYQVAELPDLSVAILAETGQLFRWFPSGNELVHLKPLGTPLPGDIGGFAVFSNGSLWVAHGVGVSRIRIDADSYQVEQSWDLPMSTSVTQTPWGALLGSASGLHALQGEHLMPMGPGTLRGVQSLKADVNGQVAVATDSGLQVMNPHPFQTVKSFLQKGMQTVAPLGEGVVTLVFDDRNLQAWLYRHARESDGHLRQERLAGPIEHAQSVAVGAQRIWVATGKGEVKTYSPQGEPLQSLALMGDQVGGGMAWSLAFCQGSLWAVFQQGDHNMLRSVDVRGQPRAWGAAEGLRGQVRFVRCLDEVLYVGISDAHGGLLRWTSSGFVPVFAAQARAWRSELNDVGILSDGALVLATERGLWTWREGRAERRDTEEAGSTEQALEVRALAVSPDGWGVWFGTNRGVRHLSDAGQLTFQRNEGLLNPTINPRSVVVDEQGDVWVSHYRGLARLSPHFRLRSMPQAELQPLVSMREPLAHGSSLLVSVRSPFYPTNLVQYQFRVDGSPWKAFSAYEPIAVEGLASGEHLLEVRAGGAGLNWSTVSELPFAVARPWYLSLPFLLLMTLAAVAFAASVRVSWRQLRARLEAESELRQHASALAAKHEQLALLLRHVRQGILSIGADRRVRGEFSAQCEPLLGRSPQGERLEELLADAQSAPHWRACLDDALAANQPHQARLFLSLLPEQVQLHGRTLGTEFVALRDSVEGGVMVTLTDLTERVQLQQQLQAEARRLSLLSSALSDREDFFSLQDEFRVFLERGSEPWAAQSPAALKRHLHTCKGSFAQLGFEHLPDALHELESRLMAMPALPEPDGAVAAAAEVFSPRQRQFLDAALQADLAPIAEALGEEFLRQRGVVSLNAEQAAVVEAWALRELAASSPETGLGPSAAAAGADSLVWHQLAQIRQLSLRFELDAYGRLVSRLASQLGKQARLVLEPGEDFRVSPERHRGWLLSLGHLFRNAVDHGIESPDERFDAGKPECGTVRVTLRERGDGQLEIVIEDDGSGLNEAALRAKARALQSQGAALDAEAASLEELIFFDGLSARSEVSEVSGRGVGLAALRGELRAVGGEVRVETRPGQGTRFTLTVPV